MAGVAHDDVLNVRVAPGPSNGIVGELAPTEEAVTASGEARQVGTGVWWEVDAAGISGWVHASYLAAAGATTDVTSAVVEEVGEIPTAATMAELADIVIGTLGTGDPSEVVVVAEATGDGPIADVTVDAFVWGDDAIRGLRLVVFGQTDATIDGYSLYSVEATHLCWRGADADGLCV